jgi:hypothetical protein
MMEDTAGLVPSLDAEDDDTLHALLQRNVQIADAVFVALPDIAQDAGFDVFGKEWMRRYWRRILSEVSSTPVDELYKWALAETAVDLSNNLISYFGLDVHSFPAAVALAILLLRIAKKSGSADAGS